MAELVQILIAKYPNSSSAEQALKKLQAARENQGVQVTDAAVVRRNAEGKLQIHETEDVTGGRGATVGGILGGVLGLIAGPPGLVAGAALGAVIGSAAANMLDTGIPHKRLEEIGQALHGDQAALVVLTEEGYVEFIEDVIGGGEYDVLSETMDARAAHKLGREHDIALQALKMGDALADGGMASPTKEE
jgi:uncharacterized membrane protein